MSAQPMSAVEFVRYGLDDHYECARCGWPVVHMGANRFKHACSFTTGASPCKEPPTKVMPRGSHKAAIRSALSR